MFTPGISSQFGAVPRPGQLSAGQGIAEVEGRIQQIESLIQSVKGAEKSQGKSFRNFLQDVAGTAATSGPSKSMKARKAAFQPLIENLSKQYGMDKDLVNAVITQESGFNPHAVSKAGATGLMQLMPATAKTLGVNPADPAQNLDGGIRHLKNLLTHYHGNIPLSLAAYNAGMGAVSKYNGVPPYKETQNYVRSILGQYLQQKNSSSNS